MKKHLGIISAAILGAVLIGILSPEKPAADSGPVSSAWLSRHDQHMSRQASIKHDTTALAAERSLSHLPDRPMTTHEIGALLNHLVEVMNTGNQVATLQALAQLDEVLTGDHHDAEACISAILAFLESGLDAPTGQGFIVGEAGMLVEATTLRVLLMDHLGSLSREAGTTAALEVARDNLARPGSADEWAVSMRNVAWLDSNSHAFLADRVNTMLHNEAWRQAPSQGMLEAFDLIVYTGALNTVPELNRIIVDKESPLARAAGVALDRLATGSSLELTTLLNQQPALFASSPLLRADLFAHADLSQAMQRQQAENYLLRSDVGAAEREKFLGALLQNGQFVSHNLVTPFVPPETPAEAGARLNVLTETLNLWIRDERLAGIRDELVQYGTTINQIQDEITADLEHGQKS